MENNTQNNEMASAYDPKSVESRIYNEWLSRGFFASQTSGQRVFETSSRSDNEAVPTAVLRGGATKKSAKNTRLTKQKSFTILLPPPNITGSLHMGHALNATISDILIRYHRMKGFKTAWLPGIDHAGIAAQNVVEKNLRKENISRFELGREKFIAKIWEWKNKYGNIILDQLKKLGASCDWSRTRFTMDPAYSEEVLKAFVHYHEKGLIYRGKRMVSWCVRCGTSLSDLEIEHKEETGKLYFIKYPLAPSLRGTPLLRDDEAISKNNNERLPRSDQSVGARNDNFIIVATTRPETMLGDSAVAVNPKDKRYKNLIGKKVLLPIVNREIPIIADSAIDMTFGTGAVKVTPAHDMLDNEIGTRHNLPNYEIISERGKMQNVGAVCDGLKVTECREKVVAELQTQNLIEKIEDLKHNVAKCYRCDSTLEPLLSNQWFLKMGELAKKTIKTVKSGKTKIVPKNFEKPFFDWLKNIKDWCISRQIWWGHQLPVWFCAQNQTGMTNNQLPITKIGNSSLDQFTVSIREPATCPFCKRCKMIKSSDVLDTWFSSALWPFAGFSEADLKSFYPSDVLITARDIINLWVGRMIFSGLEFMKNKTPFHTALIHATVLAKDGRRMSKSLGTGVDPLELVEKYGADATRFGIIWQAMGGQDIRWDENAVMAGKKFANKIWNAARFAMLNSNASEDYSSKVKLGRLATDEYDKKIYAALKKTKKAVESHINKFEFGPALHTLYDFFWHEFCDVYIEKSKERLNNKIVGFVLVESLKILHPFMPHITEEIYQKLPIPDKNWLIVEKW